MRYLKKILKVLFVFIALSLAVTCQKPMGLAIRQTKHPAEKLDFEGVKKFLAEDGYVWYGRIAHEFMGFYYVSDTETLYMCNKIDGKQQIRHIAQIWPEELKANFDGKGSTSDALWFEVIFDENDPCKFTVPDSCYTWQVDLNKKTIVQHTQQDYFDDTSVVNYHRTNLAIGITEKTHQITILTDNRYTWSKKTIWTNGGISGGQAYDAYAFYYDSGEKSFIVLIITIFLHLWMELCHTYKKL